MATTRQEKLADAIIENHRADKPKTNGEMLEAVGYAPTTARHQPGVIIESKGTKEALAARGFTVENANEVVGQILMNPEEKAHDRLDAADKIYKVHGSYAPEKKLNLNLNADVEDYQKYTELSQKYDEEMKRKLSE